MRTTAEALIEEVPGEALDLLARLLGPGEEIVVAVRADMAPDQTFTESYLLGTTRRVLSCTRRDGSFSVAAELPLAEVIALQRRDLHGMARLDARTADRIVPLVYYNRSRMGAYESALQKLNARLPSPPAEGGGPSDGRRHRGGGPGGAGEIQHCPKCNRPIPKRLGCCPDCLDQGRLLLRLLARARPYLLPMSGALILMLFITAVEMVQPLLTKVLVDRVIPQADLRLFAWIIAALMGIHLFSAVFSGTRAWLMAWLGEHLVHTLRTDVYNHLQTLSLDFYDQHQTGWIMDRVSADTGNLQNFVAEGLQDLVRDVMTVSVILVIMFSMNPTLALITLIPAPLVFFLTRRFLHRIRKLYHSLWRKRAGMSALLSNVIPGARVVRAFTQEHREAGRFTERSESFMNASIRTARSFATFHPTMGFVTSLGFILVWACGGYQAITAPQAVSVGTLIAFISYLWRFYGPLNNLGSFSQRMERAATSAQRIFDVLDMTPSVADPAGLAACPEIRGEVTFRNVTFGYQAGEPVLQDVSFTVQPGEMIGLVGPSGAGKSTTINLLCRFYDVDSGAILIDGRDLRDVTLDSLRRQIGVVLQDPYLFHGTIAENIAYGNPDASVPDIIRAARAANAHDFILRLPEGYDTLVGERGQRLSGGERQRLSIARAILKNPRILILDEATSSVDAETEATLQEAMERLVKGRTTIAIAHRFSTLRNADRLVVLEHGRLAEIGSHEELLAKPDGLFKRLVDIQNRTSQIVAVGG
jgi:ATP-binding cassette subfamily B protein